MQQSQLSWVLFRWAQININTLRLPRFFFVSNFPRCKCIEWPILEVRNSFTTIENRRGTQRCTLQFTIKSICSLTRFDWKSIIVKFHHTINFFTDNFLTECYRSSFRRVKQVGCVMDLINRIKTVQLWHKSSHSLPFNCSFQLTTKHGAFANPSICLIIFCIIAQDERCD